MRRIVIANCGGFWGDDPSAPRRQVEGGPIDYLVMDYLAEVTMADPAEAAGAQSGRGISGGLSLSPAGRAAGVRSARHPHHHERRRRESAGCRAAVEALPKIWASPIA